MASPGFGAAANCILALVNVEEYSPLPDDYRMHVRHRNNPVAGAITTHHRRTSKARLPIASGAELLVSYGSEWFESRPQLGPIPLYEELDQASKLLERWFADLPVNDTLRSDLWTTFVQETNFTESRILGAFHNVSWSKVRAVHYEQYQNNVTAALESTTRRNPSWLEEHGVCGDTVVPKVSEGKGYGAFTRRRVREGQVILPVPLIHLPNRDVLDMYKINRTSWSDVILEKGVVSNQLYVCVVQQLCVCYSIEIFCSDC